MCEVILSAMEADAKDRRLEVLDTLAELVTAAGPVPQVLVYGPGSDEMAEELGVRLGGLGHLPRRRRLAGPDGRRSALATAARCWPAQPGWDIVVQVRDSSDPEVPANPAAGHPRTRDAGNPVPGNRPPDVVVDVRDPARPVIRHVSPELPMSDAARIREAQAFFGARAAGWDAKFGDDLPAYAAAVRAAGYRPGDVVADIGCGTGRALPYLREAVGPAGGVLGVELTLEMLAEVRAAGRGAGVGLLLGDALRLPLPDGVLGGAFAAGLVNHLPDPVAGLAEIARATRRGGRLALFHPTGRVALAARHGRTVGPDEPLSEGRLTRNLAAAGWRLDVYDDAAERFLAVAVRAA